jgi:hypothetical protein
VKDGLNPFHTGIKGVGCLQIAGANLYTIGHASQGIQITAGTNEPVLALALRFRPAGEPGDVQ